MSGRAPHTPWFRFAPPDRTGSLPNRDLDVGHENLVTKTSCDFGSRCGLEEPPLAGKIEFRLM